MIRLALSEQKFEPPPIKHEELRERLSVILAGKYRILQQLGSGGMATVWLVRHRAHGALLAVKLLHPEYAAIPELKDAFHREAAHTAVLAGHPNIVPVFDIDSADGLHYFIMPFVRGCDLDQALHRCGHFSIAETLTIAHEIAKTLAYAEQQNILHGDLALGNIRIDQFGRVLVMDFGLSQQLSRIYSNGRFKLGTPYAMSPEHIRGEAVDIRSDLYSLGVLLFHVVTGKPPFDGTVEEIEDKHLNAKIHIPKEILASHSVFGALLEELTAKDPTSRPPTAAAAEERLRKMGADSRPLNISAIFPAQEDRALPRPRLTQLEK